MRWQEQKLVYIQHSVFTLITAVPCRQMFKSDGTWEANKRLLELPHAVMVRVAKSSNRPGLWAGRETPFAPPLHFHLDAERPLLALLGFQIALRLHVHLDPSLPSCPAPCPYPRPTLGHGIVTEILLSCWPADTLSSWGEAPPSVCVGRMKSKWCGNPGSLARLWTWCCSFKFSLLVDSFVRRESLISL